MATIITEEPTTGPDTFILRTARQEGHVAGATVLRRTADGWGPADGTFPFSLTWEGVTHAATGTEVTIELLAVPPVTPDPELNIEDVKHRLGLWNNAEHKWASIGGRGLAVGLITRELPMLIKIAEAITAPRAPKTEN